MAKEGVATRDEFKCQVSPGTKLEAYIGRRDEDVFIELAFNDPISGVSSVCLSFEDARELSATLANLADRVEKHLNRDTP